MSLFFPFLVPLTFHINYSDLRVTLALHAFFTRTGPKIQPLFDIVLHHGASGSQFYLGGCIGEKDSIVGALVLPASNYIIFQYFLLSVTFFIFTLFFSSLSVFFSENVDKMFHSLFLSPRPNLPYLRHKQIVEPNFVTMVFFPNIFLYKLYELYVRYLSLYYPNTTDKCEVFVVIFFLKLLFDKFFKKVELTYFLTSRAGGLGHMTCFSQSVLRSNNVLMDRDLKRHTTFNLIFVPYHQYKPYFWLSVVSE